MGKIHDAEKELYLEMDKYYDPTDKDRRIDDPVLVQKYLQELYEQEEQYPSELVQDEQNLQFDKHRAEEVLYYERAIVEAKTQKRLRRIETLVLNRISLLNHRTLKGVQSLETTVNELVFLLEALRAKKESTDKIEDERNDLDDLLNAMFDLNDIQMETLKKNLEGENNFISLTYVGRIGKLREMLRNLRSTGIDRKDILRVFTNYIRFKPNHTSSSEKLTIERLDYKKI